LAAGGIAAVSAVFAGVMLWSPPAVSSPEGPVSQVALPSAAVAGNRVFWTTNTSSFGSGGLGFAVLCRTGRSGNLKTKGAPVQAPTGIAIDIATGRIYWANTNGDSIAFANLWYRYQRDVREVYWANANSISFARLDGSGHGGDLNTSCAQVDTPEGVAIDASAAAR
jgi:hypothetical protein